MRAWYPTQDPKYSIEVNEGGAFLINAVTGVPIPADEPVFLFRAKDRNALEGLYWYRNECDNHQHGLAVEKRIDEFEDFAARYPERMKEPDTTP